MHISDELQQEMAALSDDDLAGRLNRIVTESLAAWQEGERDAVIAEAALRLASRPDPDTGPTCEVWTGGFDADGAQACGHPAVAEVIDVASGARMHVCQRHFTNADRRTPSA